ncbi:tRNA glutamyl-Q synthetase [Pseudohongiella acticola]|uniref:Glutamyl-Q tRNA(Asp) synthetase n=1 Tax=Pseudohongiella acticola TaxID=1524254 RepID=A0A1E8CFR5_9GAMM|nr:tRNA glutamyl-Q(34) synthetase GluQRS [Pseudohongiella acticola]OFE11192.1 tRNA glutamyl-Q synthetase [Pseudohongiella acticola]
MTVASDHIIGRFAPSPSGALHFGSLLAALASFLDIRSRGGQWLLRMEDLDPAREPEGAADQILRILEDLALTWDGPVLYQSQRIDAYEAAMVELSERGLTYPCDCSRQRVRAMGGIYDNLCRTRQSPPAGNSATRFKVPAQNYTFDDRIQGHYQQDLIHECGDFVLRRRDGLIAYQLAVVVDDEWQGITDILRGHDLLDSTPRQMALQQALGYQQPDYAHIPVATNQSGQKLSKQHFARPLQRDSATDYLYQALTFLHQQPPLGLRNAPPSELVAWAITNWDIQHVPKLATIPVNSSYS